MINLSNHTASQLCYGMNEFYLAEEQIRQHYQGQMDTIIFVTFVVGFVVGISAKWIYKKIVSKMIEEAKQSDKVH